MTSEDKTFPVNLNGAVLTEKSIEIIIKWQKDGMLQYIIDELSKIQDRITYEYLSMRKEVCSDAIEDMLDATINVKQDLTAFRKGESQ